MLRPHYTISQATIVHNGHTKRTEHEKKACFQQFYFQVAEICKISMMRSLSGGANIGVGPALD
jgi:hypothetical protein